MQYRIERLPHFEIEEVSIIFQKAIKRIFKLPTGTSNIGLMSEIGIYPMEQQIHYRKLLYLHKLLNMPDNRTPKKLYMQQKLTQNESNFNIEINVIIMKYNIWPRIR